MIDKLEQHFLEKINITKLPSNDNYYSGQKQLVGNNAFSPHRYLRFLLEIGDRKYEFHYDSKHGLIYIAYALFDEPKTIVRATVIAMDLSDFKEFVNKEYTQFLSYLFKLKE